MMFSEIVGFVQAASPPIDVKLALSDVVADPIEVHVNCFGAFLFYGVIGDARGGAVVSLDRSRWLGMAEFFEADTDQAGFLAVVEESGKFGFSSAGDNFTHDLAEYVDCAIGRRKRVGWRQGFAGISGAAAEEVVASSAGTSFGGGEI